MRSLFVLIAVVALVGFTAAKEDRSKSQEQADPINQAIQTLSESLNEFKNGYSSAKASQSSGSVQQELQTIADLIQQILSGVQGRNLGRKLSDKFADILSHGGKALAYALNGGKGNGNAGGK